MEVGKMEHPGMFIKPDELNFQGVLLCTHPVKMLVGNQGQMRTEKEQRKEGLPEHGSKFMARRNQ